jgi:heat shock protein HslJ
MTKPMVATMLACAEPIMQQGMAFQTAFGQSVSYTRAGEHLTLTGASGQILATFTGQSTALAA